MAPTLSHQGCSTADQGPGLGPSYLQSGLGGTGIAHHGNSRANVNNVLARNTYPREHLDEAGAAVADCSKFTSISRDGAKVGPWMATTIPIPLLGDQSLGIRVGDPNYDFAIDHLWVRSGHNLLEVSMVSKFSENNEGLLEDTAQDVLDGLGR